MAQTIKHAKTSGVPDGGDPNQVQPSDWNADHQITGSVAWTEISGRPTTFPATPASTTEVLTGTDAAKAVTPDALAALWEMGANVASAASVVLGEGGYFSITGSVPITSISFATPKNGRGAWVTFVSAGATLTHSANLILPGSADINPLAGDRMYIVQEGTGIMRVLTYQIVDGRVLATGRATTTDVLTGGNAFLAVTPDALAALWERGADLTAAAALTLGEGGFFNVNGSFGNITSIVFSVLKIGRRALLYFAGTNTIVHGTELSCPGGANLPVVAGDIVEVVYRSADRYNVSTYRRQAGGLDPAELASTTEVLTGTDATKAVTPDALAALWERGATVAAAATMALGEGGFFTVSSGGGASITDIDFAEPKDGRRAILYFNAGGVPATLVNSATLVCPGSANIVLETGDRVEIVQYSGDTMVILSVIRADGTTLFGSASTTEVLTGIDTKKSVTPDALAALWESIGTITTLNAGKLEIGEGGWAWLNVAGSINGVTWTPTKIGRKVTITITGGLPLLVHSNDLHCPGNANIQTVLGDRFEVVNTGGTSNRITWYQRADGQTVPGTASTTEAITGTDATKALTPASLGAERGDNTVLTIATGAVTLPGNKLGKFRIAGQGGVADSLSNIYGGVPGAVIILSDSSAGAPITYTSLGNMRLNGDFEPGTVGTLTLVWNTQSSIWQEVSRSFGYLPLSGGTLTGNLTISNTGPVMALIDTDTGADSHVSASSANGSVAFRADVNNEVAGSQLILGCDGTDEMTFGGGVGGGRIGLPTGAFKGLGTLNAVAVYDDNVLLTCMALTEQFKRTGKFDDADLAEWDAKVPPIVQPDTVEKRPVVEEVEVEKPVKDKSGKYRMTKVRERRQKIIEHEVLNDAGEVVGKVREQATEEVTIPGYTVPRVHHTARVFKKMIDEGFKPGDPKAFIEKMRADGAMPGMPSAKEWAQNEISSGEMVSRLWLSLETMGLAFEGLLKKLDEGT